MRLSSLSLENYRSFENLDLQFSKGLNVFAGLNGAGKSSVLDAISTVLSVFVAKLKRLDAIGSSIRDEDVTVGMKNTSIRALFENEGGSSVNVFLTAAKKGFPKKEESLYKPAREWASQYVVKRGKDEPVAYMLFAHYKVHRAILDIPHREPKLDDLDEPLSGYDDALSGGGSFRKFFAWFREMEDYELEMRSSQPDYSCEELNAVRLAIEKILPGISDIRVRRKHQAMVVSKNGKELSISQLSDGEKCYLSLVGDIAFRMARLNTLCHKSASEILKSAGIVLIDELDLHLHPAWQREAVKKLPEVFPEVQFIITTHSPQMLGGVKPEKIQLLVDGRVENPRVSLGLSSNDVLELCMKTEIRDGVSAKMADDVLSAIDAGDYVRAEERLNEMRIHIPNFGEHPLYTQLKTTLDFYRL